MFRNSSDIGAIVGLVFWASVIGVWFGVYGLVIAALALVIFGIGVGIVYPRYKKWKSDQHLCPHGVRGGLVLEYCTKCIEERRREEKEEKRRTEIAEIQQCIRDAAAKLLNSEAERLTKSIIPSISELRLLSPQRFEDEIAAMFKRYGYTVQQTPYSNDFGRDAIIFKNDEKFLVECKRYGEGNTVGRPDIQKFHSAIISDQAKGGYFITTGTFSSGAIEHAAKLGILTLVDGDDLLRYLIASKQSASDDDHYVSMCTECGAKLSHRLRSPQSVTCQNGHVVEAPLSVDTLLGKNGEEAAPRCIRCSEPMKLINGPNGRFWGCSQYPRCRSSRPWRQKKA